jgi:hypothetical protein
MFTKYALMMAAAPLALVAVPADAALFSFDLTGAYTASFQINDPETQPIADFGDYFEINATGTIEGRTGSHIIAFNTTAFDGGLTLGDSFANLWGPQMFAGSTGAPTLLPGSFTLFLDGNAAQSVLVNVTAAVPEPATWAMMVLSFGVVGATVRRRKVSFATA